jgi:hypothetical protein
MNLGRCWIVWLFISTSLRAYYFLYLRVLVEFYISYLSTLCVARGIICSSFHQWASAFHGAYYRYQILSQTSCFSLRPEILRLSLLVVVFGDFFIARPEMPLQQQRPVGLVLAVLAAGGLLLPRASAAAAVAAAEAEEEQAGLL